MKTYVEIGEGVGELVEKKQVQYGDSAGKSGSVLQILYPNGIPTHAFDQALLIVRVLDKLMRIAQQGPDRTDLGGENPWFDIAGYALLALKQQDQNTV